MARYQFFSIPASNRQQYTYVDMASPASDGEGWSCWRRPEVEEDFIDATSPRRRWKIPVRPLCGGRGGKSDASGAGER